MELGLRKFSFLLLRLGRLKMTVFSAVTYGAAATLALQTSSDLTFNVSGFVFGYMFVLSCQLVAHYTGEYYDLHSDKLNIHATPLTGGSKVLVSGAVSARTCLVCAWSCVAVAVLSLEVAVRTAGESAQPTRVLGYFMLALAHQYSAPPFMLNHRGLGEAGAACVMNVLLPCYAGRLQGEGGLLQLAPIIVPATILKFALFLVLNMEDRRADWAGGKITLPVIMGEENAAELVVVCTFLAHFSPIFLLVTGCCTWSMLFFLMLTMPAGMKLAYAYIQPLPFRHAKLVLQYLKHTPGIVLCVFAECLVREVLGKGVSWSLLLRTLPLVPFVFGFLPKRNKDKGLPADVDTSSPVVIIGAGVGGLTLAIALRQLGIPVSVWDKVGDVNGDADDGADIALWPGASAILQQLGVGDDVFWAKDTRPIHDVRMTVMREGGTEDVLKRVSMKNVCAGTGRSFCLIGRTAIMRALWKAVGPDLVKKACAERVTEDYTKVSVDFSDGSVASGRIVVGADGIHSCCRAGVTGGKESSVRYGGEVCYRGLVDLRKGGNSVDELSTLFSKNESEFPDCMPIVYGDKIRFSWGYINASHTTGYWFVKQLIDDKSKAEPLGDAAKKWPHPLPLLVQHTVSSYIHSVQDRPPLPKWSSPRITLVGDACHAVTPNNGQGACMAVEDALVLAVLLRRYWNEPDGHIEAFYRYERARREHTSRIHAESYKQMKLGQLSSPLGIWVRETLLRLIPTHVLEKKLRAANMYDCVPWIHEFTRLRAKVA